MPEEYGGAGLGVARSGRGDAHRGLPRRPDRGVVDPHQHVRPAPGGGARQPEQKARWLPPLVRGEDQVCFGVTEPDAGLDTTSIKTFAKKVEGGYRVSGRKMWTSTAQEANKILLLTRTTRGPKAQATDGITLFYTDLDRNKVEVRRIPKHGRNAVDSNAVFIDDLFIPDAHRIGEEGKGFRYLLDGLNPERILVAVEAIGIGEDALRRATQYARERVVFNRPIGMNQSIQHPLAECWVNLQAAHLMASARPRSTTRAALRRRGQQRQAAGRARRLPGLPAGGDDPRRHGLRQGVPRRALLREVLLHRLAPSPSR
jgi:acyl-CoA dehydrogenase